MEWFLHHTRGVSGDVIFAIGIHARHFGGFAAYQRAARLPAAFGHAGHNLLHHFGIGLALGHIVQEHQGFRPLRQHIVHAHGHGIDADGVVLVHGKGDFQFGTHAVGAAHQDGFLHAQGAEVEHAAEGADVAHHPQAVGRTDVLLDAPDHVVTGFQAHACFFVINCHIVN